jgi:two-component system, NarL family, sensor histidine kinase UhpB
VNGGRDNGDVGSRARDLAGELAAGGDARSAALVSELADELERVRRQITRVGLDLHDDALQDLTALRNDLQLFRGQVDLALADSDNRQRIVGRVDDFLARVVGVTLVLRELAVESRSAPKLAQPLSAALEAIVGAYTGSCSVEANIDPQLDSASLSEAERVTIVRLVQSALGNVLQHSGAATASVGARVSSDAIEIEIVDDGVGFDVEDALAHGARHDRLGLAGMRERADLLGGTFRVSSRVGGPTRVVARLPVAPRD